MITLKDAFENLKKVCAGTNGTLEFHMALQESLEVVRAELEKTAVLEQAVKELEPKGKSK